MSRGGVVRPIILPCQGDDAGLNLASGVRSHGVVRPIMGDFRSLDPGSNPGGSMKSNNIFFYFQVFVFWLIASLLMGFVSAALGEITVGGIGILSWTYLVYHETNKI